jgi:hypothetical protein
VSLPSPAPAPWKLLGSSVFDAEDKLVVVLAGRLTAQRVITTAISLVPEMHDTLLAVERHLTLEGGSTALLDEIRALLDKIDANTSKE